MIDRFADDSHPITAEYGGASPRQSNEIAGSQRMKRGRNLTNKKQSPNP